jgi:hypothetical protein
MQIAVLEGYNPRRKNMARRRRVTRRRSGGRTKFKKIAKACGRLVRAGKYRKMSACVKAKYRRGR